MRKTCKKNDAAIRVLETLVLLGVLPQHVLDQSCGEAQVEAAVAEVQRTVVQGAMLAELITDAAGLPGPLDGHALPLTWRAQAADLIDAGPLGSTLRYLAVPLPFVASAEAPAWLH